MSNSTRKVLVISPLIGGVLGVIYVCIFWARFGIHPKDRMLNFLVYPSFGFSVGLVVAFMINALPSKTCTPSRTSKKSIGWLILPLLAILVLQFAIGYSEQISIIEFSLLTTIAVGSAAAPFLAFRGWALLICIAAPIWLVLGTQITMLASKFRS